MPGTILFQDSFDGYAVTADLLTRYLTQNTTFMPTGGRYGGGAVRLTSFQYLTSNPLPVSGDTAGTKFYWSGSLRSVTGSATLNVLAFADSTANVGTNGSNASAHINLRFEPNGGLSVWRGTTQIGTTTAAGTVPFSNTVFFRFEIELFIDDTIGTCVIKINETQVFTFTGDTRNGATASIAAFLAESNGFEFILDDVLIGSGTGFLGDMRIEKLTVTGNGSTVTGTAVGAATAALAVDEPTTANGDTDYVLNQTAGNVDLFAFSDLVGSPVTIIGVGVVIAARGDGTNQKKIQPAVKSGATTAFTGIDLIMQSQSAYQVQSGFFATDPATGAAWASAAAVNAAELGYKITL